ncbi:MAG: heterodisulfide reductase-related iron-sulfur binding cluster [Actinomycetota bacterium]
MDLKLDDDELNKCVQCGLCLPHCPTYRITGDETLSPRGRIKLMREVHQHDRPITADVLGAFDSCVQCRGCEPACPSGVPYGHLIERTRATLADEGRTTPWWQRLAMAPLARPRLLRAGTVVLAAAQRVRLVPKRLGLPASLPFRSAPLPTTGDDVHLFTGCVMDAMQRDVHRAVLEVLDAAGFGVMPTGRRAPCCGALHSHAGLADGAVALAERTMAALDDDRPILVDSAGCGAAMKEYGHLVGTAEAKAFAARVFDVSEFLADHLDRLPTVDPLSLRVAVQDPCHLRHVQRVHQATRDVLGPYVTELVELDDDGLCCGAGGAYSVLQPDLAGRIRDRKVAGIEVRRPDVVASANPGCAMHLGAAGVPTRHPFEIVHQAITTPT